MKTTTIEISIGDWRWLTNQKPRPSEFFNNVLDRLPQQHDEQPDDLNPWLGRHLQTLTRGDCPAVRLPTERGNRHPRRLPQTDGSEQRGLYLGSELVEQLREGRQQLLRP